MHLEVLTIKPEEKITTPPLLFVHGASHAAWCWKEHFLPYFAGHGYAASAVSVRGHGGSEGREQLTSFRLSDYTEDVLKVLEQLGEKTVLIGHSLGGAIVQRIWMAHPEKLCAVVLLTSSPPRGMGLEWAKIVFTRLPLVYQMYLFNIQKRATFPDTLLFSPAFTEEERLRYARQLQPESMKAAEEMIRQDIKPEQLDLTLPRLVIGSRQDRFFSEKIALNIGRAVRTEPHIFADISHDVMLDPQWERVAETMLHFLRTELS